jgi:hypothetical protein
MTGSTLPSVLKGINWQSNIDAAFSNATQLEVIEQCLMRIAQWSAQLEVADDGNPALSFVRETQVSAHQSAALIGLCMYKAAAASARSMVESMLYYTFFRTHLTELTTLVRLDKYYITKSDVLDYHKVHTKDFVKFQDSFGLVGKVESWYSKVSAVVHGQIPGAWNSNSSLSNISFSKETHKLAVECLSSGETIIHQFLLCTSGGELWDHFTPKAKTYLLKGIPGEKKALLGLDSK